MIDTDGCIAGDRRGTRTGYNKRGCRCVECRSAAREYERVRRRARNPEAAEAARERSRQWAARNPDRIRENRKRWVAENPERAAELAARHALGNAERCRKWAASNPDKRRAKDSGVRARRRGAFVEVVVPQQVYERDDWTCHICDMRINKRLKHPHRYSASVDHIVALANGGLHCYDNVAAAHLYCNQLKGAR